MSQHGQCGLVTDELSRMHGFVTKPVDIISITCAVKVICRKRTKNTFNLSYMCGVLQLMSQHDQCGLVTDELRRMHGYVTKLICIISTICYSEDSEELKTARSKKFCRKRIITSNLSYMCGVFTAYVPARQVRIGDGLASPDARICN